MAGSDSSAARSLPMQAVASASALTTTVRSMVRMRTPRPRGAHGAARGSGSGGAPRARRDVREWTRSMYRSLDGEARIGSSHRVTVHDRILALVQHRYLRGNASRRSRGVTIGL